MQRPIALRDVSMNILLFLLLLIIFTPFEISAQDTLWTKTFGGGDEDFGRCVQGTTDGGFIIVAYTRSYGFGNRDIYLIKTDAFGDTLWTRLYGDGGWDEGESVQQTMDGGYVITGGKTLPGEAERNVYLVKTDSNGDTLWSRQYGGPLNDTAESVRQTTDLGYIVTGWAESPNKGTRDGFLLKTDASGDTLWTRVWGDSLAEYAFDVQQTLDGGYIVTGGTASFGAGGMDVFLIKTDTHGKRLWEKTFGGSGFDLGKSVHQTMDGGYIIAGEYSVTLLNTEVYLIRTDASGDTLWTKRYGGFSSDRGEGIRQLSDGGFIVVGTSGSWGVHISDAFLLRTDSDGEFQWVQTYGGNESNWGESIDIISDGEYIITGKTGTTDYQTNDIYLVRVTESPIIIEEPVNSSPTPKQFILSQNYPNPFNPSTTIQFTIPERTSNQTTLTIYDIRGRQVRTLVNEGLDPGRHVVTWDGKDNRAILVSSGIYLYELKNGEEIQIRKMMVVE